MNSKMYILSLFTYDYYEFEEPIVVSSTVDALVAYYENIDHEKQGLSVPKLYIETADKYNKKPNYRIYEIQAV